jgi:TonB family protein
LSQDLGEYLRGRAKLTGPRWPFGLAVSLVFHATVAGALLVSIHEEGKTEEPKITWVTLPAASDGGPLGGSGPAEQGKQGERLRRVEEVAPKPVAPPPAKPAPAVATPNTFGTRHTQPLKGTNQDQESMGKAPVASKGPVAAPNPMLGTAGQGTGGGVGIGSSIPGLKASIGVQGGSGLISDLDSDFPFVFYLQQVQERITGNWNRLTASQGRVQIYFRIRKDGSIEGARVESPSGSSVMDQSALLAVARSNPLPHLPEGYDSSSLGVRFWFTYLGN